ncbi:MAG: TatD family hydrolase [Flavobacteriales bacterium]|nr:TatD family hydrolase [Flavobacteriales bacterium]
MNNLRWIDTHAHLYDEAFHTDRQEMIDRAVSAGVQTMLLPNVDSTTADALHQLVSENPSSLKPMMGLHPCSVTSKINEELAAIEAYVLANKSNYVAIGEIGLDYYWDKTFIAEQKEAFIRQAEWANQLQIPIAIHSRESINDLILILSQSIRVEKAGVFHCFTGSLDHAYKILDLGFYLGIGGVLTFKNASIAKVIRSIGIDHLVLETDAPYLAPTPYRGKRNESSYIPIIGQYLSELCKIPIEEVARKTTENALKLFNLSDTSYA